MYSMHEVIEFQLALAMIDFKCWKSYDCSFLKPLTAIYNPTSNMTLYSPLLGGSMDPYGGVLREIGIIMLGLSTTPSDRGITMKSRGCV